MEIRDKIRKIKFSRLPKEDKYFLMLIKDIKRIKENDNTYYWVKNKSIIFEERVEQKLLFFSRPLWLRINSVYTSIDTTFVYKMCHRYLVNNKYRIIINSDRGEETWDIIEQKYNR